MSKTIAIKNSLASLGNSALAIYLLLLGLSIYVVFAVGFWNDQDWELLVAGKWLNGERLYIDHVPVTPPLIFYLDALPVFLSRHLPFLEDYQALFLLVFFLIVASICISVQLLSPHPGFTSKDRRMQLAALLSFLLVFRIPSTFFADREHLLMVFTFPYLFRWMPTLSSRLPGIRMRVAIGAMAAVGFFIKPHCLLIFAAIQLICICYMRSLRILFSVENLIIYLFGAIYTAIVWLCTPEYLTLVLPMAFATYSAIRQPFASLQELKISLVLVCIMMPFSSPSIFRRDIYYFAALLPFLYIYTLLNNGWGYTYQPLITVFFLMNGFVLWEFLSSGKKLRASLTWVPFVGILICLFNFAWDSYYRLRYFRSALSVSCRGTTDCPGYYAPLIDAINMTPRARSFGVVGMDFGVWTRVSKLSGAEWSTRFPQLWMMPKFFLADNEFYASHRWIVQYAANALAQDLDQKRPDLFFVEVARRIYTIQLQRPLDWVGDFSTEPAFKSAWQHYSFVRSIDDCDHLPPDLAAVTAGTGPNVRTCQFDVYRRNP